MLKKTSAALKECQNDSTRMGKHSIGGVLAGGVHYSEYKTKSPNAHDGFSLQKKKSGQVIHMTLLLSFPQHYFQGRKRCKKFQKERVTMATRKKEKGFKSPE